MKHKVIIAIGSNCNQETNVCTAIEKLRQCVEDTSLSRMMWTEPIGIESGRFLNCVMTGTTELDLHNLVVMAKSIERERGRNRADSLAGRISLDIDILLYDHTILHPDDWERDYIKQLVGTSE